MFYHSLVFAGIILVFAHIAARREPHPLRWGWFLVPGMIAAVLSGSMVVQGVFVLLVGALVVWSFERQRVRMFLPLSITAAAIPYVIVIGSEYLSHAKIEQLREKHPFESVAERITEPRPALRTPPIGAAAVRLDDFEDHKANRTIRPYQLRRLHERKVWTFVNNPGFGEQRMVQFRPPTEENLKFETPIQPGSPTLWGHDESFIPAPTPDRESLDGLHTAGLLDFVNPRGWGYVEDRTRVAGFLPHRFSKVPEAKTWQVQRIELMGLLKHPEPVVYLSDRLPAMAELRNAPTRAPDAFELTGLDAVKKGDDGFAARRGEVVRFVGAIRSAKQCVECHGGTRGDLLGAFSYTLRASETRP